MLENKHNKIQLAPQKLLKRSIWAHKIHKNIYGNHFEKKHHTLNFDIIIFKIISIIFKEKLGGKIINQRVIILVY